MRKIKKVSVYLLILSMLISIFSAATVMAAEEPAGDYTLADSITLGNRYIVAAEYNGEYYALAFSGMLTAEKITVNGDATTPASDAVKWTAGANDTIESVASPGNFIFAGSGGFMSWSSGRTFVYQADTKHVLMHNIYYLIFDGTKFDYTKDEAEATEILIFEKEMAEAGAETGAAEEEVYVPDGSDLSSVVKDAVKNADGSITLAFASDTHHSLGYAQNNLDVWMTNLKNTVGYIDSMGFCGDMGSAYSTTATEYWANAQGVIDYMDAQVEAGYIGTTVYTYGNHEWYPYAGGDYMNNYENNPTADRLLRVGEGIKTDDYIIYCLGAGAISANFGQGYSEEDINRIDTYLATAPKDIPIFVISHFPIHYWDGRITENAAKLAEALNKYPNIVVIWGHNHSNFDTSYDTVMHAGDKIVIDGQGTQVELNFTYLAAGCISDAEYTGVSGGSAWVMGKGLIVTIDAKGNLSFDYYTMDGLQMSHDGPYLVEYRDGVNYQTFATEYVEEGKAANPPAVPEIPNFKFIGWDVALDAITRHTVATALYAFDTGLDPAYVYFTVQEGGSVAIGKSGTPILLYAIPYAEGMTAFDGIKALHDAEFAGGSADIGIGVYGAYTKMWGHVPTNGAWIMDPGSSKGYIYSTDALTPGGAYYVYALDGIEFKETSYLSPFTSDIVVGEAITMNAVSWAFDITTYGYFATALNGDVYVGTAIDTMTDTGIDAVSGEFKISFDKAGTYYVGVKSANAGLAATVVTVNELAASYAPQTIALGGKDVAVDAYTINGETYVKLRDVACALNSFEVAYDAATKSVVITTGAAYTSDGTEMQTGEDNAATAVISPQSVYVNGAAVEITGFNIGGNNYYKLDQLAKYIGF